MDCLQSSKSVSVGSGSQAGMNGEFLKRLDLLRDDPKKFDPSVVSYSKRVSNSPGYLLP